MAPRQLSDSQSLTSFFDDEASESSSSFYEPPAATRLAIEGLAEKLNTILEDMPEETPDETKGVIYGIIAGMLGESPIQAESLVSQLEELTGISPELRGQFKEILEEIGRLGEVEEFEEAMSDIGDLGEKNKAADAIAMEHPKTKSLSDVVITSESGKILETPLDQVVDETAIKDMSNSALESDAERIAREEEEEERKRKSAESGSNNTNNNYNHFSTSKDLDPNIAAAGIKLTGVLAIALGIGGPAGLILAGLFLIATKNIANGKTVTHINSRDETYHSAPEVGDNFLRNMMQSAQAQVAQNQTVSNAPTNMLASTGQALKDMQAGLTPHQQTLKRLGDESKAVDAKKSKVDERTDQSLEMANTPRSDGTDISSPRR